MQCSPFRLVASRSHNPEEGAGPEDFNGPTPHAGLLHRVGARDRHLGGFSNNDHQRCPPSGEESHSRKVEVMRERWRSFERVFCCTSLHCITFLSQTLYSHNGRACSHFLI